MRAIIAKNLALEIKVYRKKQRARIALTFALLFLLSCLLCLFIIGFSEVAHNLEDWLISSFISIFIDMSAF